MPIKVHLFSFLFGFRIEIEGAVVHHFIGLSFKFFLLKSFRSQINVIPVRSIFPLGLSFVGLAALTVLLVQKLVNSFVLVVVIFKRLTRIGT
jgi:hypothetical protein